MGSNEDGDAFGYFCEKDLLDFHYETDGMKKAHLQRKVNVQMYHEACARYFVVFYIFAEIIKMFCVQQKYAKIANRFNGAYRFNELQRIIRQRVCHEIR